LNARRDESLPAGLATGDKWGVNIGGFVRHYDGWVIRAGPGNLGYSAQARNATGRPAGPRLDALTLDELAAKIDAS